MPDYSAYGSSPYTPLIQQAAQQYGVPPQILYWQLNQESGLDPNAPNSSTGAEGIAQILPSTASSPGYGVQPISDPTDPSQAIPFAAAYDAALYNRTGSWTGALTSYGTLANVPAGVTQSWNSLLQTNGLNDGGLPIESDPNNPLYGPAFNPNNNSYVDPLSLTGTSAAPGLSGVLGLPNATGWLSLVEELAVRIMLGLVGMVLLLGGFYVAGQRSMRAGSIPTRLSRLAN